MSASKDALEQRLARLERTGALRRGSGATVFDILRKSPPKPSRGEDVLQALFDERVAGR